MCVSSLETCPRRSWHSSTRELPWSVLNAEIARRIGLLDAQGEPLTLSTRTGKVFGKLVRAPVSLVADAGESLELAEAWERYAEASGVIMPSEPVAYASRYLPAGIEERTSASTER